MRRHYRNSWSAMSAQMMSIAHTRAPMWRWLVVIVLVLVWAGAGFVGWYGEPWAPIDHPVPPHEAIYRTIGALSMSDTYVPENEGWLNVARFAGLGIPIVGLLFAFWGELGRSIANGLHALASDHIVIAGAGPAAVHLAQNCRAQKDSVVLIGAGLPEDLAWSLQKGGVYVIDGAADRQTLKLARAHRAAHVVAFEDDDTLNLQIEASMRALVGDRTRGDAVAVHVGAHSAMLLREARAMRSTEQGRLEADNNKKSDKRHHEKLAIDSKPFSLDEIAARRLIQTQATELLDLASQLNQPRIHIVCFGFDESAQAVASHVFMSLWSARFEAPRVTVLSADPDDSRARFRARHPQALAYPDVWAADIAFHQFEVTRDHVDHALLAEIGAARGQATGVVVSAGKDPENIRLALALKRACNEGAIWPVPIFMKESTKSEFSSIYAKGDETAELDAYLLAFGALQSTATRRDIIEGRLDQGAAIAHAHYTLRAQLGHAPNQKELQAASRNWSDILETYRAANRAVSDASMVKMWDAGWRAMRGRERGDSAPTMPDEMMETMAQREHLRWMAERLMAGWRPGSPRNNTLMIHDKLIPWDQLNENDKENDRVQVRAAMDIAKVMYPRGFEARAT